MFLLLLAPLLPAEDVSSDFPLLQAASARTAVALSAASLMVFLMVLPSFGGGVVVRVSVVGGGPPGWPALFGERRAPDLDALSSAGGSSTLLVDVDGGDEDRADGDGLPVGLRRR